MTLYILAISGADVILGVDWLKTLGRVVTNYTTLSMKFHQSGQPVEICVDVPSGPIHALPSSLNEWSKMDPYLLCSIRTCNPPPTHNNALNRPTLYLKSNLSLPNLPHLPHSNIPYPISRHCSSYISLAFHQPRKCLPLQIPLVPEIQNKEAGFRITLFWHDSY